MNVTTASPPRLDLNADAESVAAWIVRALKARGVDRIFGLQGGHIQPIWDRAARAGIAIVDVRDERAAVHMAHAHAELTGKLGVAMATAGPGVTNTVTSVANASLARIPVLVIGGCTPRPQANMGPLQEVPQVDIMRPIARYACTARVPEQAVRELDQAIARAMGDGGEPGPAYIEFPTDVLRRSVPERLILPDWLRPKPPRRPAPEPERVAEAVAAIRAGRLRSPSASPKPWRPSAPPAGRWRSAVAAHGRPARRSCGFWTLQMRSISTPRNVADLCPRTILPLSVPYAPQP